MGLLNVLKVRGRLGHSPAVLDDVGSVDSERMETSADFGLLARCRAGDEPAWRTFYEAHFNFVYRVARRLGTPEAEVEDVSQEVFLVAFRRLDSFSEGKVSTWLYRIAANVVSARHRGRRVRRLFLQLFSRAGAQTQTGPLRPDQAVESTEVEQGVQEILERMGAKKREVFALFELEGLSGDEIAERVACPVETVWSRLHYARREFEKLARDRGLIP